MGQFSHMKIIRFRSNNSLTTRQKRTIDSAVKKTVKEYKKTLDLLAKT
jgi:hypothetical protein